MYLRRAAALLVVLGSVCVLSPRPSAQLASLVVTLTAPPAGSTVTGTTIVRAQVTIVGALTVSNVQFKVDGNPIGAPDSTAPYSIEWDTKTASNGIHTLTACARDLLGVVWDSEPVQVTVFNDLTPPTVAIASPASGASLRGTITLDATAADNVGVSGVQFRLDGANLGAEDTTAPYSIPWSTATAANGSHTLTAIARDAAGNTTTASSVAVVVDNAAPAVAVTAPAAGSGVRGSVTITADASDNIAVLGVRFLVDGVPLGAEDLTSPYSVGWDTIAAGNGAHTLTAVARDAAGNVTTSGGVAVTVDNAAPSVSVTSPATGATVSGSITATASASDNVAVAGVQFMVDGAAIGAEDTAAPYSADWNTNTASNGTHTLTAIARDTVGNLTTSVAVSVTVSNDTTPPTVAITAPPGGASVDATVVVTAGASDNVGVAGVQFLLDGAMLGIEDTVEPYSIEWDTRTASNGAHALTAVARDAAGNLKTSATVTVTVTNDTTPPTVAITAPANGATVSATVSIVATASDNGAVAGVQFFVDGAAHGPEDVSAPYEVSWNTVTAAEGSHTLTARARDAAGHTTTSGPVTVTVTNSQTETTTRLEDNSSAIAYTTATPWVLGYTGGFAWSGGTASLGFAVGQRATLTFNGIGVKWIGFRGPQTGIANVYLDGALVATIDAYNATQITQVVMYTATGLVDGPHTLAIEVTRTKNDAATDYYVVVDAFDVTTNGAPSSDTTPPVTDVTAPASGATVSGMVPITASASDNVAVSGVRFYINGTQVGAEDTASPYEMTWNSNAVANGSHTLTTVARDAAGNTATSAPVTVTVSNAPPPPPPPGASATRIEDTHESITYVAGTAGPGQPPDWFHGSRSRVWSDATATFNRSAGARATVAFNGTGISWISFRSFWAGIARVYVDGTFVSEIDLFLPRCTPEQKLQGCIDEDDEAIAFTASGLPAGPHTLTIEVTGTRNPAAEDNAVVVDAFDIAPPGPVPVTGTRIEEASNATFTGAWSQGDTTGAWSGGTAAISDTAGARATMTFTGTEFRWVGRRGPQGGIARVFLDGALQAEVDQYFATNVQAVVYTATGLAPGSHTLTIEVTTLKHKLSTGTVTVVDAIDARTRFEERDAAVTFAGVWAQENMARPWSGQAPNTGGGTAARSSTAGARAEFAFNGTEVRFIGMRWAAAGIVDISIDGVFVESVDLYSPTEQVRATVFTATGLTPGPHTLRIEVTGQRNPASGGTFVFVDAFDVVVSQPAPVITRVQQTDPAVSLTPPPDAEGWSTSTPSNYFSGRTVALATSAGSRATFTFTGTTVRWIGQRRRDAGMARVYVDGVLVGTVDLWTPIQDEYQAAVFSATGLSAGTHTLTIEVSGTKRGGPTCAPGPEPACSSGYLVIIDAFEIY